MYFNLETFHMKAATMEEYDEEFSLHKEDFNYGQLSMQLGILYTNIPYKSAKNLTSIICYSLATTPA